MANSLAVADYVIEKGNQLVKSKNNKAHYLISNLYLQGLLFFLNLKYYQKYHQKLITDEPFTVSDFTIHYLKLDTVFEEYRSFEGLAISHPVKHLKDFSKDKNGIFHITPLKLKPLNQNIKHFIDKNLLQYLMHSPFGLMQIEFQTPCYQKIKKQYIKNKIDEQKKSEKK